MTRSEVIARAWHESYERLAPEHGCALPGLGVKWEQLTAEQQGLLIAVVTDLRSLAVIG
jgi:hypothetical protein